MTARPTGIVTFLFTDVAASTRLWERDADAMARALERHDALCRAHFERRHGYVFATGGDGFAVAFGRASDGLDAATGLQAALASEPWPERARVEVRMAMHAGEAVERDGDYFGPVVNTAARLLAVAHGGQILVSDTARQLLGSDAALRDLGVHRLRDLGAPVKVWQVGDDAFPPLRSLDAIPGNLPTHLPPLIGRHAELPVLVDAVSTHRLVTLTGVGGVGKTRLALALAGEVASDLSDGAWFVDLSPRESDDDLAAVVSVAIGADATAIDRRLLIEHLRERRMLIVLDNCEHVIDAAAELAADLLAATDALSVLATSREPLGIEGEHVHRVRSLALPAAGDEDAIARAPAVMLFLDRARDAGAPPGPTADVRAVAEICRHLDGIPLAIELAAARTRAMSAGEILARIDERFRLLGGGRRSRERHRTLTATVQWSHDLLTEAEQVVWRRLAVFVGGFDLEAAEAIVARPDTMDALLSLVDKSMVQVDASTGRTRYWMLETLRQFAADRLAESGEVDVFRSRHAEHYLQRFGLEEGPPMRGPDEQTTWAMAASDRDNVVVAAERMLEHGRAAELVQAVTEAPTVWIVIAPADGARLLELAAAAVDDEALAARALGVAAFLAWESGDPAESVRLGLAHLARTARAGATRGGWAVAAMLIQGNFDPSLVDEAFIDDAVEAVEREDDDYLRLIVNGLVGSHRRQRGDPDWHAYVDVASDVARRLNSESAFVTLAVVRASEELRNGGAGDAAAAEILAGAEHHAAALASTPGVWFQLMFAVALFDLDRPKAMQHLRNVIRLGDQLGPSLPMHLGYEGVALARALEGRLEDAAVLRAVSDNYFGAAGPRVRGDIASQRIRQRLDAALADTIDAGALAAAQARAHAISRQELLELALSEDGDDLARS